VSNCPRLLYAQHVEGAGKELFAEICRRDLEGIVAKRKTGVYREDRQDWLKVKKPTYSQPKVGTIFSGGLACIENSRRRQ
jgi:ATP-dependent DNA ligase